MRALERSRVDALTNSDLEATCGLVTVARGLAYAREGRVIDLSVTTDGRSARGLVAGSGGHTYESTITLHPDPRATWRSYWGAACTCPMLSDCKHVVAVAVAARVHRTRIETADPSRPAPAPRWEQALLELIRDPQGDYTPLGLLIEERTPPVSRYSSAGAPQPSLVVRPVIPGSRGDWIRTGVSWESLSGGYYGYGRSAHFGDEVRDAMTAIADAHRRSLRSYSYGRMPDAIPVSAMGPHWCDLLRAAAGVGVHLMTHPKREAPVAFAGLPGHFLLEVERDGEGAVLRPRIDLPGADASSAVLVGSPASGWYLWDGPTLVLGALAQPLDSTRQRLVEVGPLRVPPGDWDRFVATVLPGLRRRVELRAGPGVDLPEEVPPRLILTATFIAGHVLELVWEFCYGPTESGLRLAIDSSDHTTVRDLTLEHTLIHTVEPVLPHELLWRGFGPSRSLVPRIRVHDFDTVAVSGYLDAVGELEGVEFVVVGEPTAYTEVLDAPLIAVSATEQAEGSGTDWFDLAISVTVGGEEVPLAQLIAALSGGAEHLLLDSGTWFSLDRPELLTLRDLLAEARTLQDKPSDPLRISLVHAGLWEELVALGVVDQESERWSQAVSRLLDIDSWEPPRLPDGLRAQLRPYQESGYTWLSMLWDLGLGGVLADDMGLGKTLQMLAMIQRAVETRTAADPVLIVAPTSVLSTWASEAARFTPGLRTVVLARTRAKDRRPLEGAIAGAHLVITSYAVARIDEAVFRSRRWSAVVLDEAQFVKNHQSKTYQVIRRLPADRAFAITGTPLENSLMDLWSLLSIVAPGLYPRPGVFRDQWSKPIESGAAPQLLGTLRSRIKPLMLRRTKDAVAADLPPKQEQVLHVDLHPRHRAVYDRHLSRERQRILGLIDDIDGNRIAIFRALTTLRQLALDPALVDEEYSGLATSAKLETLVEHLRELAAEGHRALVFSQFTRFLQRAREELHAAGLATAYLDGATRRRAEVIEEFRTGDATAFLISLKAGGFGLTLTEADYVFVLDPWWNPAAENQAIDRTHRIGQTQPVNVYRLVSTNTIESKVVDLQTRKRDLFARVVDDGDLLASGLTAADLAALLERPGTSGSELGTTERPPGV